MLRASTLASPSIGLFRPKDGLALVTFACQGAKHDAPATVKLRACLGEDCAELLTSSCRRIMSTSPRASKMS